MSGISAEDAIKLIMLLVMVTLVTCVIGVVLKELFLKDFLRTIPRARQAARWAFYERRLTYKKARNSKFEGYSDRAERAAIWFLYQVYASWSYSAISRVCTDLALGLKDLQKEIQSVSTTGGNNKKEKDGKSDKNAEYVFCEYGKSCEYKDICYHSSPVDSRIADSSFTCHRMSEIVKSIEYEPTTTNPFIRCAAALKGECDYEECKHFANHTVTDSCWRPAREGECIMRRRNSNKYSDIDNLVHCIVSDSSVEINLAFKRKKNHESR